MKFSEKLGNRHMWILKHKNHCRDNVMSDATSKNSSSSFKPFRGCPLFFFELYSYVIGVLETLYTSDVTAWFTESDFVRLYAPTLEIHSFAASASFYMRFFCWVSMAKEIMFYTLTRKFFYDATGTLRKIKFIFLLQIFSETLSCSELCC
jgi:hypothetical protein